MRDFGNKWLTACHDFLSSRKASAWKTGYGGAQGKANLASKNQSSIFARMQASDSTRSPVLEPPRSRRPSNLNAERKQELGQFLTPESIGVFMASLFEARPKEIRLLD